MNERKELIEYRTSNSKYFLKKDGTIEVEIYDKNILPTSRISVTGSESNTSVIDTYIYSGDTNTSTYNQDILKVGVEKTNNKNTIYRSLLKFELPKIPAGYKLTNAQVLLYAYPDDFALLYPETPLVAVHAINKDWTESNAKWNTMSDKYDSRVEDYFYCSRTDTNHSNWTFNVDSFNITKLVQEWYNGRPNYGVMLKQYQEETSSDIKVGSYVSKDYSTDNQPLKPKILITYKNYNGLENYLSYTSQNHFFGTSHISNYTGNLTTIFNVANTIGGPLPASLYLVYNTLDINEKKDYGYGLGIKPNLIQTIEKITIEETEMLKYLDEDGTTHYFYKETNDEEINKYHDEDGLELTIELVDNNYIMTDKDKNTNKFINHNGIYYLEEIKDTNNKAITIQYGSNNRISKVIDASLKEINITYETNKITFISPHLSTIINLTNNLLTSITSLNDTETITYNKYNLIEKIINPNNIALKYEYVNDLSSKISKISEISKEDNIGNYLTFNYELDNTTIIDNKNHINTYLFNQYGNVIGITNLDDNNLHNAYGKSYSFGTPETNDINKLLTDKSLIKYVDNIIDDSSFENENDTFTCEGSITKSYTNDSRSGKKALKFTIDDDITTEPKIYNTFYVGGYDSVTLSFYAKGHGMTNLMLYTGSPVSREDETIYLTDEFKRYSITYNLENATSEKLNLVFNENYFTDMIIDDIQLEEGDVANYYNLIDNSNFDSLDKWNIYGAKQNETSEIVNLSFNLNALKIHSEPQGSIQLNRRFSISGKAGDTFNLSFWYKCNGIIPTEGSSLYPGYWATIFFKYPNSEEDGVCVPYRRLNIGNNNWQFFSENFTAEEDYEYLEITVNTFGGCNDLYLTNFSLFKDLESYSYVYDDEGNLVSSVDLSKETSQFAYNSNNQLIEATSPLGKKYKYEYDDNVTDRLIKAISPTGITNSIDYDENNNPIRTRINNTEAFSDIEETNYYIRARGTNAYINIKPDKNLEVLENTCSHDKFKIIILPNDRVKIQYTILNNYYLKDNNGILKLEYGDTNNIFELIKHTNKSYSIASVTSNLAVTLEDNNSLSLTTYNEDNSNQQFLFEKMDSKLFIESSSTYTSDGRFIKSIKDSLNNEISYNINNTNGLINSITDPNGNSTNYTYDNKLRITNITKGNHSVSYEYNNDNNLSKIIHGTKNYIFNYDEFNNSSSVKINNNTLVNNYYEDNNGNLNKVLYGNNHEINYTYDSLDRLDKVIKSNDTYTNYYDNLGRITKITSNNDIYKYDYDFAKRLSTFKYNNYETNYNYDKENNVIEKKEELLNNKYTYNYEYNDESSLTKLSHSNNNFN
ncbi:MAG TPA: RHS repeat protein, partial [Candidatus Coprovivens excrementavium]|nr:RHS repeat protein [Candidatus Coprovivens excrementavium]